MRAHGIAQGETIDISRHQPWLRSVRVGIDHRGREGSADSARGPDFAGEPGTEIFFPGQLRSNQFHGHAAAAGRSGQEHAPHPATAKPPKYVVLADLRRVPRFKWFHSGTPLGGNDYLAGLSPSRPTQPTRARRTPSPAADDFTGRTVRASADWRGHLAACSAEKVEAEDRDHRA